MSQGFYGFPNILGLVRATTFKATGKAGATGGAALAGGTASGAPVAPAGPFDVGDMVVGQNGTLWICTSAGTSQSSPGTFTQVGGTTSPLSTKGDVWVYGSADARLGVGADTTVLTADSTQSLGLKWAAGGSSSLTTSTTHLGTAVTMTSANTDYTGPALTLGAGTWLVQGHVTCQALNTSGCDFTAMLTDGTTVYDSAAGAHTQNNQVCLAMAWPIVLSGTTTIAIKVRGDTTGNKILATPAYTAGSAGNTASALVALQIA